MALDSTGRTHWEGDLFNGKGTATVDSGAFGPVAVDWKARSEEHGGKTSPEELIAAAHATCYSMAFSNMLAKNETPPTSLDVSATVTFVPGTGITHSRLTVTGVVPGIDEAKFQELAEQAKENCPVSKALQGNVELSVEATLANA
ncbi:MAG: OsmC family protein [Actinomycetes bacterium]|jgi:osmotically inducible protein OsmC|nr:MAG: peroxiredoxin [Actinomycetota bacterium]